MWFVLGGASGFLSVAAGAFAAHALKGRLSPENLQNFETAARYEMYHALALLAVGLLSAREASPTLTAAGWAFLCGTVLFSGSLYALSLTGIRWFGAITPVGGVAFLLGWAAIAIAALRVGGS